MKNREYDVGSPPYDHVGLKDMRQFVYRATLGIKRKKFGEEVPPNISVKK